MKHLVIFSEILLTVLLDFLERKFYYFVVNFIHKLEVKKLIRQQRNFVSVQR